MENTVSVRLADNFTFPAEFVQESRNMTDGTGILIIRVMLQNINVSEMREKLTPANFDHFTVLKNQDEKIEYDEYDLTNIDQHISAIEATMTINLRKTST